MPLAIVTDLITATKAGTYDLKYCNPTDDDRNSQVTLVDDTDQNGKKNNGTVFGSPKHCSSSKPQPPPYHVTTSLSKYEDNIPRETELMGRN